LKPGDRVEIFTRGNQVMYYRKLTADTDQPAGSSAPAETPDTTPTSPSESADWLQPLHDLQSEISLLKAKNQTLVTESNAELARNQEALAQLKKENEELRATFQREIQEVRTTTAKDRDALTRLETEWKQLAVTHPRPPMSDVTDVTRPDPVRPSKRAKPGTDSPK